MTVQYNPKTGGRGIEWTDRTENPIGGCLHNCKWEMPDGTVAVCYAKELAENGVAKAAYPHGFEHHYWRPNALKNLTKGREPELIFPDSMSDMFERNVPEARTIAVLDAMRSAPHHTFQALTKAPARLLKFLPHLPPNLWVGVSSPPDWFMGNRLTRSQQHKMLARTLEVLATIKRDSGNIVWLSAEPVSWDLTEVINRAHPLDWIIIGAASNGRKYFQPDVQHIRSLLDVMDQTATAVFYKGNIKPLFQDHDLGSTRLNRWREDFPHTYRDSTPIPAVIRRQERCQKFDWTLSFKPTQYCPKLKQLLLG